MSVVRDWIEIAGTFRGADAGILVGNGASRCVSETFAYQSLYDVALGQVPGLRPTDAEVFAALGTQSFERVLAALRLAERAMGPLDLGAAQTAHQHYFDVRKALSDAIHQVHIESSECDDDLVFLPMADELAKYGSIFSTNYDLLIYWAMNRLMEDRDNTRIFYDHFLHGSFDRTDYVAEDQAAGRMRTRVLYLHGALHLFTADEGGVHKLQRTSGRGLLELSGTQSSGDGTPLFVAEGSAGDKVRSIRQSEYLDFALQTYDAFAGPLTIFGHRLDDSDYHLLKPHVERAAEATDKRPVAVSVRQSGKTPNKLNDEMRRYRDRLHPLEPVFFEATTHPLGDPRMCIDER